MVSHLGSNQTLTWLVSKVRRKWVFSVLHGNRPVLSNADIISGKLSLKASDPISTSRSEET